MAEIKEWGNADFHQYKFEHINIEHKVYDIANGRNLISYEIITNILHNKNENVSSQF